MARPSFKPTTAQRRCVAIASAGGMAHEDLAIALEISRNTLEKHFAAELSIGANKARMAVLLAQYRTAMKGNVSAQKAFLASGPVFMAPPAPTPTPEQPAPRAPKLGKKEQAAKDAVQAGEGTGWQQLLEPQRVVKH